MLAAARAFQRMLLQSPAQCTSFPVSTMRTPLLLRSCHSAGRSQGGGRSTAEQASDVAAAVAADAPCCCGSRCAGYAVQCMGRCCCCPRIIPVPGDQELPCEDCVQDLQFLTLAGTGDARPMAAQQAASGSRTVPAQRPGPQSMLLVTAGRWGCLRVHVSAAGAARPSPMRGVDGVHTAECGWRRARR